MSTDIGFSLEEFQRDRDPDKTHLYEPLFRSEASKQYGDPDSIFNASLSIGNDWDTYAVGYKLAADNLVDTMPGSPVFLIDALPYPILFLYRHYFELRLKEILQESSGLLGMPVEIPKTHKLMLLWGKVRPNLESILKGEHVKVDNDVIAQRLTELSVLDPKSESFRYPIRSTEHAPSINLKHTKYVVQAMSNILDVYSGAISQYLEFKHETMTEPPMM